MKESFGHPVKPESTYKPRKKRVSKKEPKDHFEWIAQQTKEFTLLEFSRHYLLNENTAGNLLRRYRDEGKIEMLPRKNLEVGKWRKIKASENVNSIINAK